MAPLTVHALPKEEVYRRLLTSGGGLSQEEAARRLHEFGPNEIRQVREKSLLGRFFAQFTHFLAVLLGIAAVLSFLSAALSPGEGMGVLGAAIAGVIVVNAAFTFVQEYRAEKAAEALRALLPFRVKVLRDGARHEVAAREVVPGDVVLLNEGDRVPADVRVVASSALMVNNAALTGESDARPRGSEPYDGDYLESPNVVFAGTHVVGGSGTAVAFATGMATEFGKIAHLAGAVGPGPTPLQKEIQRTTRIVAAIAAATGIVFFAAGTLAGRSFWHNFLFAVGIIVANVPEGLLPTVTLALAMGSQRMARRKALVKTLMSVETLGSVTVICTDKTGTLTRNAMEVRTVWLARGGTVPVSPSGGDRWHLAPPGSMLLTIASLCTNAAFDGTGYRGDPTEAALLRAARERIGDVEADRLMDVPFDTERKRMTTVNRIGGEAFVLMKGAPETVLPLCTTILAGDGPERLDGNDGNAARAAYDAMADEGLRVIAFAFRPAGAGDGPPPAGPGDDLEREMTFVGLAGLADPLRPEVPEAVRTCREAGIRVIMITGDAARTAAAVARQAGLATADPPVVGGRDLDGMSDAALREVLSTREVVFARMTPRHKMGLVSFLQDEGERVAVTGDGVNDAPALKKADVGVAMGVSGTDVAREVADIVLLDDNFATIVSAVEEGRAVFENIRKFVSYIFASNVPEIVPYIAYVLFRIPLPLTILQILAVDLGTDMVPALGLGAERPSGDVMRRPPRKPSDRLLTRGTLTRSYLFLGPIEAFAGLYAFFHVLLRGGWRYGEMLPPDNVLYMEATTACLAAIVVTQVGNVFACRSFRESVFSLGLLSNRLILLGVATEIALIMVIVYHPWGHRILGTAPLRLDAWLLLFPFGALLLGAEEARKALVRRAA
jgi:sodium/potassium-transporting ATPase subunit alpha